MSYVIDRRLNGKNKSTVNRQRFLRRYRDHIKKAVEEAVSRRSITDMEHGEQISIPGRDIDEPVLHHGRGGKQTVVHPGNKDYVRGDRIERPSRPARNEKTTHDTKQHAPAPAAQCQRPDRYNPFDDSCGGKPCPVCESESSSKAN